MCKALVSVPSTAKRKWRQSNNQTLKHPLQLAGNPGRTALLTEANALKITTTLTVAKARCPFKAWRCDTAPLVRMGQLMLSILPTVNKTGKTQTKEPQNSASFTASLAAATCQIAQEIAAHVRNSLLCLEDLPHLQCHGATQPSREFSVCLGPPNIHPKSQR